MKYRIWDTKNRKYVKHKDPDGEYLLEEFTGFFDAHNEEIYENDVWMRLLPIYRNDRLYMGTPGRCGYLLIFKMNNGNWSIKEEECLPSDGEIVGTIHDVDNI